MNHPHDQDAVLGGQSPGASRDAAVLGGTKGRDQAYRNHYNFLERLANGIELAMIAVPSGTFLMGSPETELERLERESPQHSVSVPSYFLGRYPITQAEWRAIALLPQIKRELNPDPSHFKGEKRPVEQVSWHDATEFCARLSAHTGRTYRLPSEAEWEYGCRAGTTTPFHLGETISTDLVNYDGNYTYGEGTKGEYRQETTPVDHFGIANGFGLCEMHGNAWEWCGDDRHESYADKPEALKQDGSVIWSSSNESRKVVRGGSWYFGPRPCRSACRDSYSSDGAYDTLGFRVVCVLPRTS